MPKVMLPPGKDKEGEGANLFFDKAINTLLQKEITPKNREKMEKLKSLGDKGTLYIIDMYEKESSYYMDTVHFNTANADEKDATYFTFLIDSAQNIVGFKCSDYSRDLRKEGQKTAEGTAEALNQSKAYSPKF